jgi:hypothetical protein
MDSALLGFPNNASTLMSESGAASQLPYPRADSLTRSGLVQYMFCDPHIL